VKSQRGFLLKKRLQKRERHDPQAGEGKEQHARVQPHGGKPFSPGQLPGRGFEDDPPAPDDQQHQPHQRQQHHRPGIHAQPQGAGVEALQRRRPDGRGGWSWYTGSAGWLYEVMLRDFLGFDKRGNAVTLRPRAPADWEECTLVYRFGESRWQLTAARDARYVTADGEKITGLYVPLRDDGKAHEARFPLPGREE